MYMKILNTNSIWNMEYAKVQWKKKTVIKDIIYFNYYAKLFYEVVIVV